jgi:hypothetical protein
MRARRSRTTWARWSAAARCATRTSRAEGGGHS